MSQETASELLDFAARCLENKGAVIGHLDGCFDCLLPDDISDFLSLPQETRFGPGGNALAYGLPLLDRLVELATSDTPVVYGSLSHDYLKQEGFDRILMQNMVFPDAKVQYSGRAEVKRTYMILAVKYTAISDERKEGLIKVCLNESSRAALPEMIKKWPAFSPHFYPRGKVPPHFPIHMEDVLESGLAAARRESRNDLQSFINSMKRRLRRDITSTTSYYSALASEMEESLGRTGLSSEAIEERRAKIAALPAERDQKISDLVQKYSVHQRLVAKAALRFIMSVVQVSVSVQQSKKKGQFFLVWNPILQAIEPVACARCGSTIRTVYFCEERSGLVPVCGKCN